MTDKIIQQGEFFTICLTDKYNLGVPYYSQVHGDGATNHGFIDLRDNPADVEKVSEAKDKPGLISLLKLINSVGSPLMSLGCENGIFSVDPEQRHSEGPTCYVGSYVDIAFRDINSGSEEKVTKLAESIIDIRKPTKEEWTTYGLDIGDLKGFFGNQGLFYLSLRIMAFGQTNDGAWVNFNYQCKKMADVIETLSPTYRRQTT